MAVGLGVWGFDVGWFVADWVWVFDWLAVGFAVWCGIGFLQGLVFVGCFVWVVLLIWGLRFGWFGFGVLTSFDGLVLVRWLRLNECGGFWWFGCW